MLDGHYEGKLAGSGTVVWAARQKLAATLASKASEPAGNTAGQPGATEGRREAVDEGVVDAEFEDVTDDRAA